MNIKLTKSDIKIINEALKNSKNKVNTIEDILKLDKSEIWLIIDNLTDLIGYDNVKDDIDDIGCIADDIIGKLLNLLISRNEID